MGKLKEFKSDPADAPTSAHVVYSGYHKPTGERWLILGIDTKGDRVCVAGWPPTIAKLSDCENVQELRRMTVEEHHYRRNHFGYGWDTKRGDITKVA